MLEVSEGIYLPKLLLASNQHKHAAPGQMYAVTPEVTVTRPQPNHDHQNTARRAIAAVQHAVNLAGL